MGKSSILLIFLLLMMPVFISAQGYYNQENFGNRSMLLGGNVTGSVDDLGLSYYNPARIALVDNPVFAINAKAYQMNTVNFSNIFGTNDKLSDSNFRGIPSLVAGTFQFEKWEKHHFAYTFITRRRDNARFTSVKEMNMEQVDDVNQNIDRAVGSLYLYTNDNDEWIGLTWGMKLNNTLSIGVSTFVSIYNYNNSFAVKYASLDENEKVIFYNNEINLGQSSNGIFWKIGLAWKRNNIDLGLNIDLPYLEITKNGNLGFQRYLAGTPDDDDIFDYYDFQNLEAKRKEPIGISFGLGVPWGRNKFHFKTDWHSKLSEYDRLVIPDTEDGKTGFAFKESFSTVVNFGVGADFYLNDGLRLYGSFSTDFSPVVSSTNIFDLISDEEVDGDASFNANFMHYGLGVEFKLKKVELILGTTYSSATSQFAEPIEVPSQYDDLPTNEDPSTVSITRWRFIVGLEIPIFGYEIEFK